MSIETIQIRKCDICGNEMPYEHTIIKWPDDHKEDVCKHCTRELNKRMREMRMGIRGAAINEQEVE